jgi:hypothetical protein
MPRLRVHPGYALNLPAPIYSGEHEYRGLHGFESKCGLDVWWVFGQTIVMLTELVDNPGTSVTNYFEHIATELFDFVSLVGIGADPEPAAPDSIIWIEHYERTEKSGIPETWERVRLEWNGERYHSPAWEPWERLFADGSVK